MFGFRVTDTLFILNKELRTKEIIKPHLFEGDEYVDLDNFSDYAFSKSIETLRDLGYSLPNLNSKDVMWLRSVNWNEYLCLTGTTGRISSHTFTIYVWKE